MATYKDSLAYSNEVITNLRQKLNDEVDDEVVAVCGSFSRREASAISDIDYFTLATSCSQHAVEERITRIDSIIKEYVPKGPASGGAFSKRHSCEEILNNIGGQGDNNDNITRRILFLLEGDWLSGEREFRHLRKKVLEKYIAPTITDHQLALFLLNDIIRYYRTVCVDYEFKTVQAATPKPWAIRNIKLIFSRKLLYASGLFSVALTCDQRFERKIKILEDLFDIPCIDRIAEICGNCRMGKLRGYYDAFLTRISDEKTRTHLESLSFDKRSDDETFRDIKNVGHLFSQELQLLFSSAFSSTHPIHKAVVF